MTKHSRSQRVPRRGIVGVLARGARRGSGAGRAGGDEGDVAGVRDRRHQRLDDRRGGGEGERPAGGGAAGLMQELGEGGCDVTPRETAPSLTVGPATLSREPAVSPPRSSVR